MKKGKSNMKNHILKVIPAFAVAIGLIFILQSCCPVPSNDDASNSVPSNDDVSNTEHLNNNIDSSSPVDLNGSNFKEKTSTGITLVDFWAEWCPPCRIQNPILEDLAAEIGDMALIAKVDVDDNQDIAASYNVRSIPTLILFKEGEPVERFTGVQQKETLISAIDKYLK